MLLCLFRQTVHLITELQIDSFCDTKLIRFGYYCVVLHRDVFYDKTLLFSILYRNLV